MRRLRLAAALLAGACAGSADLRAGPVPGRAEEDLRAFLDAAPELGAAERSALLEGRPFLGMTPEQAELSLRLLEVAVDRDGRVLRATYLGAGGRRYHVDYGGDPPRAVFWSLYAEGEIELRDPAELRPDPPLPLPPRR